MLHYDLFAISRVLPTIPKVVFPAFSVPGFRLDIQRINRLIISKRAKAFFVGLS